MIDELRKIDNDLHRLQEKRNAIISADNRANDLALLSNVEAAQELYNAHDWRGLESVYTMGLQLLKSKALETMTAVEASKHHANIKPGFAFPKSMNMPGNLIMRRGVPIIVGAGSGVGKSTFARNIAAHNALKKIQTVIMSNEETKAEVLIGLFTIISKLRTGITYEFSEVENWLYQNRKNATMHKQECEVYYRFAEWVEKYVWIVECEYWPISKIIYGIEDSENHFGQYPECVIIDYIQRVEPEHNARTVTMREQNVQSSRMITNYAKTRKPVMLLVSQLNDAGRTAESTQFEKDATQKITIERDFDDTTQTFSDETQIMVKKNRKGMTGRARCFLDGKSGAFLPHTGWTPEQGRLNDSDRNHTAIGN